MIAIIPFILGLLLLGNALNQTSADACVAQSLSGLLFMAIGLIMAVYFRLEKRWGLVTSDVTSDQNQED